MEEHTAPLGPSRVCPQPLSMARALSGTARQAPGSVLWSCLPMLLLRSLQDSWQRLGWHCQGGCKLHQHLTIPMVWVCSLSTGDPRAEPGTWLVSWSDASRWSPALTKASNTCWWITQPWVHQESPHRHCRRAFPSSVHFPPLCIHASSMVPPGVCPSPPVVPTAPTTPSMAAV